MPAKTVKCAKLGKELPGIDPDSEQGERELKMITLIAGAEFAQRVANEISQQALDEWNNYMLMLFNEFRVDPTSDEANQIIKPHMASFFFGEQQEIPNYVPPEQKQ